MQKRSQLELIVSNVFSVLSRGEYLTASFFIASILSSVSSNICIFPNATTLLKYVVYSPGTMVSLSIMQKEALLQDFMASLT